MFIQSINGQNLNLKNHSVSSTTNQCPCSKPQNNLNDMFVRNKSNVTFGDSASGAFFGYILGSVAGLVAIAATPVTGGLSMAAVYGASQLIGAAVGSKVGQATDKK